MRWMAVIGLLLLVAGCQSSDSRPRSADEEAMFGPSSMTIDPIFTQVKNLSGDSAKPDGIEAVLEFSDEFGDPTKAAGTVIFELFAFREGYPDPRGDRVVDPWTASIVTPDEQRARWRLNAYNFPLADDDIAADKDYVLTATFESLSGPRLFAQTMIKGKAKPKTGHHGSAGGN